MNRLLIVAFALLNFILPCQATDLEQGWELFIKNDYKGALEFFKKASLSGEDKSAAYRGLSLTYNMLGDNEKAFDSFYSFYKTKSEDRSYYVDGLWSIHREVLSEAKIEYLESLLIDSGNGKFKARAYSALAEHYFLTRKYSKAKEYFSKVGGVNDWRLAGEFENISESGFDKDFDVLAHPEETYEFVNKNGANVKWFDMRTSPYRVWLDMDFYFYANNSIVFAQNFCFSPVDQIVQFRLGTSGSAKFWVNDELMFQEAQERNNGIDTYVFTVKLVKGYNRLLLQLGESEIGNCNFLLRITDTAGDPIEELSFSKKVQEYPKDYKYQAELIKDETEAYFLNKIEQFPEEIENYLILNQYYLSNERTHKAQLILKKARMLFPTCTYVQLQLVHSYSKDDNNTEVSILIESIKKNDRSNLIVQDILFREALDIDDYEEAEKVLDVIAADLGDDSPSVLLKKIELAGKKDEVEEIIKLVNKGYDLYRLNYSFVKLKALLFEKMDNNKYAAAKVKEKYLKKRHRSDVEWELIWHYLDVHDAGRAFAKFNELMEVYPIAVGFYQRMANVRNQMGQYYEARLLSNKCIAIAPYIGSYYSDVAEGYKELDDVASAKKNFEKALMYNPYDYESRKKLMELNGSPNVFENYFDESDPETLYANAPKSTEYPEDNSVVLLDEVQKIVYDGGGSEEKHSFMVKVFNESGVEDWKDYYIPIYGNQSGTVEKIEVYKKNGSKLEAERSGTHVVFPNLEEGDAIYVRFTVRNYYSGKLAGHFWDKHYFNYSYPILKSSYSLVVPKDKEFEYLVSNSDMKPSIVEKGKESIYTWSVENVESIKSESYMPRLVDVGTVLHISSFPNWDYISDWYSDLAKSKAKQDFLVEETAAQLFEGKSSLSDLEKAKMIYDYVTQEIRYVSESFIQSGLVPQKASRVIASKQGDCKDVSTLFVALCKTQGIEANLVLVNTKDEGLGDMMLPSIAFNHCIAHLLCDGKDYYLELTSNNVPFAAGEQSLKNAFTLDIPNDLSVVTDRKIINPETRIGDSVIRKTKVTFDQGKMTVSKSNERFGLMSSYTRNTYRDVGKKEQFKKMEEAVSGTYPTIELKDLDFVRGLDSNTQSVVYEYSYEVPSVFTEISGLQIFKLPWADNYEEFSFASLKERKHPVRLWKYFYAEEYTETLEIEIPEGKKVSEIPADEVYKNKYFDYSLTFVLEGNTLIAKRYFAYNEDILEVDDYKETKELLVKILKADSKQIAFR